MLEPPGQWSNEIEAPTTEMVIEVNKFSFQMPCDEHLVALTTFLNTTMVWDICVGCTDGWLVHR